MTDLDSELATIVNDIDRLSLEQQRWILRRLRRDHPIHPLESEWNTTAEAVLEAISRSSSLTQRGVRGVLAEASFAQSVVPELEPLGFRDTTPPGDIPYDVQLSDLRGSVRIQVKLQRSVRGQPMMGNQATKSLHYSSSFYVVETQKTRGGRKRGRATRPYSFGEFDILAVSLYPSSSKWDRFLCTPAPWLIPDPENPSLICKYQPVPPLDNSDWSSDLKTCIEWFRQGLRRTIRRSE